MSDFLQIANEYGVSWALIIALLWYIGFRTVPSKVYDELVARESERDKLLQGMTTSIAGILEHVRGWVR